MNFFFHSRWGKQIYRCWKTVTSKGYHNPDCPKRLPVLQPNIFCPVGRETTGCPTSAFTRWKTCPSAAGSCPGRAIPWPWPCSWACFPSAGACWTSRGHHLHCTGLHFCLCLWDIFCEELKSDSNLTGYSCMSFVSEQTWLTWKENVLFPSGTGSQ